MFFSSWVGATRRVQGSLSRFRTEQLLPMEEINGARWPLRNRRGESPAQRAVQEPAHDAFLRLAEWKGGDGG